MTVIVPSISCFVIKELRLYIRSVLRRSVDRSGRWEWGLVSEDSEKLFAVYFAILPYIRVPLYFPFCCEHSTQFCWHLVPSKHTLSHDRVWWQLTAAVVRSLFNTTDYLFRCYEILLHCKLWHFLGMDTLLSINIITGTPGRCSYK